MAELVDLVEHLMESVYKLSELLYTRTTTNLGETFSNLTPKQWIRLVIVVGAYCLLRPYILKAVGKHQSKQLEDASEASKAEISPNQLRGQIDIPEDSDEEDGEENEKAQVSVSDWGKKARKRQRHMIKKLLDAEEKRLQDLQDDEEDKEIEQYLVNEG